MKRARCNHCGGVFTVGGDRDCCLVGAVAEQKRLRDQLSLERSKASRKAVDDLFRSWGMPR